MEYLYQRFLKPEDWKSEICDIPRKDCVMWISELLRSNGLTPTISDYTFNQNVYHATASKAYFTKEKLDEYFPGWEMGTDEVPEATINWVGEFYNFWHVKDNEEKLMSHRIGRPPKFVGTDEEMFKRYEPVFKSTRVTIASFRPCYNASFLLFRTYPLTTDGIYKRFLKTDKYHWVKGAYYGCFDVEPGSDPGSTFVEPGSEPDYPLQMKNVSRMNPNKVEVMFKNLINSWHRYSNLIRKNEVKMAGLDYDVSGND